jgi:hypothetical protein
MPAATLTTTLSELNRLYGVYPEVVNEKRSNPQEAQRAWTDYEAYAKRYKKERSSVLWKSNDLFSLVRFL